MKVEICTPFYDDATFEASKIRFFNITDGKLTVIARNYDWNFVEITSVDWIDYGDTDEGWLYYISTGTWTVIREENEPIWDALVGNQATILPEEHLEAHKEQLRLIQKHDSDD